MSRQLLVAGVLSKVAWLAILALDHTDAVVLSESLVVGALALLPTAYRVTDKLLDRTMQLSEVYEPVAVPVRV